VRSVTRLLIPFALALGACSSAPRATPDLVEPIPEGSGSLMIEIEGLRNFSGTINVSLFDTGDGFPDDTTQILRSATRELTTNADPVFRFDGLTYGSYAVSILHDENGNGEMDTGFFGVPSEGFGFSNNPRIGFGAPSFESCRFRFDTSEMVLRVSVRYF
jgi:uncharacterized protein (DUF2141 family)